jgi:hypothetical protein
MQCACVATHTHIPHPGGGIIGGGVSNELE